MRKIRRSGKLVYGVGVNDADYKIEYCQIYKRWAGMLERCYSARFKLKCPTYSDCSVCPPWLVFSVFKSWMEQQDWAGNHLDKDLLSQGNKVYSPETCVFLPQNLNAFMTDRARYRGIYPLGVTAEGAMFKARCSDLTGRSLYLGLFATQDEAHNTYLACKAKLAVKLAAKQINPAIATALLARYCNNRSN